MNCPHCDARDVDDDHECPMTDAETALDIVEQLANCPHTHARHFGTQGSCADWCGVCGAHREPGGKWLRPQLGADAHELEARMYPPPELAS